MCIRLCGSTALALVFLVAVASAQGTVSVAVTDGHGRSVSGLEREHFRLAWNGAAVRITSFAGPGSPVSLAVVSREPTPQAAALAAGSDELFEVRSLDEAVRRLTNAKHLRRTILLIEPSSLRAVPDDVRVLQADTQDFSALGEELRQDYLLRFEGLAGRGGVEVTLQGVPALTRLNVRLKPVL